ncbi:hypothetical protein BGX29_010669, partial [Mortierella sp. GBA35]
MPPHITSNNKRAPMISLFATAPLPDLNKSATNSPESSPTLGPLRITSTPPPRDTVMDKGQDQLPDLPIPPLDQTLARYLDSVRPLTTDQEYQAGRVDDPRMPTQTARAALLVSLALEFRQLIAT